MSQLSLIPTPGQAIEEPAVDFPAAKRSSQDEAPNFRDTLSEARPKRREAPEPDQPPREVKEKPAPRSEAKPQEDAESITAESADTQDVIAEESNENVEGEAEATAISDSADTDDNALPSQLDIDLTLNLDDALSEGGSLAQLIADAAAAGSDAIVALPLQDILTSLSQIAEAGVQSLVAAGAAATGAPVVPSVPAAQTTIGPSDIAQHGSHSLPSSDVLAVGAPGGAESQNGSQADAQSSFGSQKGLSQQAAPALPAATLSPSDAALLSPLINPNPSNTAPGSVSVSGMTPVAPTPSDGDTDAINAARLTRGLKSALSQQGGQVTLRLTPPEMGTVRIQLQMQGAVVSAQFHAETESARTLLTQQMNQLRSTLESQGLQVDKLSVQAMSASNNSSGLQQQSGDSSQSPTQQQTNADGRSRGQHHGQPAPSEHEALDGDESTPSEFNQLLDQDAA